MSDLWEEYYNNINNNNSIIINKDIKNEDDDTLLTLSVCLNNFNLTKLLIESGFDINHINLKGESILINFIRCKFDNMGNETYFNENQNHILEYLLQNNININYQDLYGKTGLMYAVQAGDLNAIKLLLKYEANKNIVDKNNKKAIDYNCKDYEFYNEINYLFNFL